LEKLLQTHNKQHGSINYAYSINNAMCHKHCDTSTRRSRAQTTTSTNNNLYYVKSWIVGWAKQSAAHRAAMQFRHRWLLFCNA
jgi:hypothetical protein